MLVNESAMMLEILTENILGELITDVGFVSKVTALQDGLKKISEGLLEVKAMRKHYDSMSEDDRIQLDLLQLYTVNTLYFIHLKLQGVDVTNHPIKEELMRVREAMRQHKLVREKPKPRIDKRVAERFVRSGLWDPNQTRTPPNKKTKFEE